MLTFPYMYRESISEKFKQKQASLKAERVENSKAVLKQEVERHFIGNSFTRFPKNLCNQCVSQSWSPIVSVKYNFVSHASKSTEPICFQQNSISITIPSSS